MSEVQNSPNLRKWLTGGVSWRRRWIRMSEDVGSDVGLCRVKRTPKRTSRDAGHALPPRGGDTGAASSARLARLPLWRSCDNVRDVTSCANPSDEVGLAEPSTDARLTDRSSIRHVRGHLQDPETIHLPGLSNQSQQTRGERFSLECDVGGRQGVAGP